MNSRFIRTTLFTIVLGIATCRAELNWLTDYAAALKKAQDEGEVMLINFTGSDWCPACIRLNSEVFDEPEFAAFAKENLVLLEVDFPRGKALSASQRAANEKLARRFSIEGFPSVFIVSAQQRPLALLGYEAGGPTNYINTLKKIQSVSWKPFVYEPTAKNVATAAKKAAPTPDEPLWGGVVFPLRTLLLAPGSSLVSAVPKTIKSRSENRGSVMPSPPMTDATDSGIAFYRRAVPGL
jgi:thioredoxin-related protein